MHWTRRKGIDVSGDDMAWILRHLRKHSMIFWQQSLRKHLDMKKIYEILEDGSMRKYRNESRA